MTTLTLAYRNTPLHAAVAAAVARVLEAYEIEPDYIAGSDEALAAMLANGEIDLFATVWHPAEDSIFVSPAVEPIGNLYRPTFGFFVADRPDSPLAGLQSMADLAGSDAARHLLTPESLVPRVRQMVAGYRLTEAGFTIESQPDDEAYASIAAAIEAGEPVIAPLFTPNYLIHRVPLRPLADPQGAAGKELTARLLFNKATREQTDTDMLDELDELTLGNKVVSALDDAIRNEGMTADDAAEAWQRGKLLPR
ncbi:glycine betaine ABC transporter substrate-binding protein [Acetobacter fallax]|uniref:Glycine/betaine ABC transporter n=1 Tax=Acetobacter fallax TaxID=1737473 RepID=A0ABX0K8N7_9PROT|nr:glycine betaine ABC transporter substrate-binding protein [Acetobacter fallax]NHO32754.1 glycine/betaine ABC transporter [Acetobacter fallax]NHO36317.1 glycine/betaine ABC transporter [Acetobacter fallax]